jgi:CDGSH-type Zn-finger protein
MSSQCKRPFPVQVEANKTYSWCTCGLSQTQPLCDGSHRDRSEKKSLKWTASDSNTVKFCGCKQTKTPPFCDGSHLRLSDE